MASDSDKSKNTNNSKANVKYPEIAPKSTQPYELQQVDRRHHFRRLENGLLDVAHVPEDLVDAYVQIFHSSQNWKRI